MCGKLPDNARRCLLDKYREEHRSACDAVMSRLGTSDRNRIDALFFEAVGRANEACVTEMR
jgi:hypothetical protein